MQGMAREAVERPAVDRVAGHRPSARREVHADLMTASGHETAPQERSARRAIQVEALVLGEAGRAVRPHNPPAAIGRIGAEWQIDRSARRLNAALDDGEVVLL